MKRFKGDKEYGTMFLKEARYLIKNNVQPSYIKISKNGVKTYKFTKTNELFDLLSEFYKNDLWK